MITQVDEEVEELVETVVADEAQKEQKKEAEREKELVTLVVLFSGILFDEGAFVIYYFARHLLPGPSRSSPLMSTEIDADRSRLYTTCDTVHRSRVYVFLSGLLIGVCLLYATYTMARMIRRI
jgi:hypothetical protein